MKAFQQKSFSDVLSFFKFVILLSFDLSLLKGCSNVTSNLKKKRVQVMNKTATVLSHKNCMYIPNTGFVTAVTQSCANFDIF